MLMAMEVRYSPDNREVIIGDTLIGTLRKTYGAQFAAGCGDDNQLRDVLDKLDEPSLGRLIADQQAGKLERICQNA
jgi:hypothetical protein